MLFLFDDFALDCERRELRADGTAVPVEPQVFDLLVYLIENRARVVSKDDLIASVWGGRIVSESTLTSRINAARKAIDDSGKEQRLIRTSARKGFRFVGKVQEKHRPVVAEAGDATSGKAADAHPPLIVDRPSIAVLRFENMSDDRALELITNGLTEDIIALLARVPGFFVIARASSFAYTQQRADSRQIGVELGIRYVVTGSARSSGDRVRINVQLVEAESGNQLWAGRYDVSRGNTLDLQDEIARRIIVELEPALTKADLSGVKRRRIESVDAWSHFRRAAGAIRRPPPARCRRGHRPPGCSRRRPSPARPPPAAPASARHGGSGVSPARSPERKARFRPRRGVVGSSSGIIERKWHCRKTLLEPIWFFSVETETR